MNTFSKLLRGQTSLGGRVLVNTGSVASANLWRIVVSFLVQLLVARSLGLEALGQYAVAMAYLNISQVLCEMGLPLWMVRNLAQAPHLRRAYFRRGVLLQFSAALLLWGVLVLLTSLLPYPASTRTALFWVGASLPLFAITSVTATIFQAAERMTLTLIIEFVTNSLILLLSIWLLWQQQGVDTLLLVVVIAQGVGMMVGLGLLFANHLFSAPQKAASLSLGEMVSGAFAFLGLSLTDVLLQRIDILLLSLFGDARLLGIYSAAYSLVRVAVKLLQSVWRGVYPTLARLYPTSPDQAARLAARLLRVGLFICTLGALLVTVLATPMLRLVYGVEGNSVEHGGETALVLAWLVWQTPLFFVENYATTWLMITARSPAALGLATVHLLLLVVVLPLGARWAGAPGAAWATLAVQAIATVLIFWQVRHQRLNFA